MMINPAALDASAPRSAAGRELMDQGYTILRNAASPSLIGAVAEDLEPRYASTPFCEGGFYGERTKRFGRLLIRSPHMADLVMNSEILGLAELALGNWCDRIQLNLAQAIELHPGALAQFPHRDQDMWAGALGEVEFLINVMWPLTAFTLENGGTIIWPRSHGVEALVEEPKEAPIVAEAEPGDAIVFLGSTLHGAGANNSGAVRRGIIVSYCLGWLKPYENMWLAYPPEIARGFPPDLAALAGYAQHRPNLGNFEGQCPSILFGGYPDDPIAAVDALRPDQQSLLADYVAAQRPEQEGGRGGGALAA
ncbi:phytanoyl-CoA dioxygenase family protein [Sphingopyxis sp. QXT-31]|uniref:phytanoyl-CoA dioxygenase family protein n=1 Tax=Sphingopyxis sp. QXT-31 TaxID=1357916 RepID=UPI0026C624D7